MSVSEDMNFIAKHLPVLNRTVRTSTDVYVVAILCVDSDSLVNTVYIAILTLKMYSSVQRRVLGTRASVCLWAPPLAAWGYRRHNPVKKYTIRSWKLE